MKQRFSSLDVKVIATELNSTVVGLRLSNAYDLSSRIFLLRFHKPNRREQLVIESGFRAHLTDFTRETAPAPSAFVQRLRKYLRSRRITQVLQVGTDRVLELQFQEGQYRLFLEFYASGNIVLTDADLNVLALLRHVNEGPEHEHLRVGLKYRIELRQNYGGAPPLTRTRVKEALEQIAEKQQNVAASNKKKKEKKGDALRRGLAVSLSEFPPMLLDHAFSLHTFDTTCLPGQILDDEVLLDQLMQVLETAKSVSSEVCNTDTTTGYILARPAKSAQPKDSSASASQESKAEHVVYEDFHPFKPNQFARDPNSTLLDIPGFNKTVDHYFSSIEGQKLESRLHEREETAKRRLEQAKLDHEKRVGKLQDAQELHVRKADAILANLDSVNEAAASINSLIERGMDWVEIARLIEMEQARRNPVALTIKLPLKLYENTITLLLSERNAQEDDYEDEEDFEGDETESEGAESDEEVQTGKGKSRKPPQKENKGLTVDIDLGVSAWSNASRYHSQKKTAAQKEVKTVQASQRALKNTEAKISADLKKGLKQEKEVLRPVRKQMWFEKFLYFVSSDGYLVLGGKDAQQNDHLYRRYLRRGDVYVHADLHGAATIVIKNNPSTPDAPIPPSTLSQAGNLAVATSSAWDSKAVMSAWWVNADQVSKTAPTGEYLTTGGFVIRGKKNFLPPAQLVLGFAALFLVSDESKAKHVRHRIREDVHTEDDVAGVRDMHAKGEEVEEEIDSGDEDEHESDSDEDFPDARLVSDSEEEDFPDARLESGNEEEQESAPTAAENAPFGSHKEEDDESDGGNEVHPTARDGESLDATGAKQTTRHLSAYERRLLRKGQVASVKLTSGNVSATNSVAESSEHASEDETQEVDKSTGIVSNDPSTKSTGAPNPPSKPKRGQRTKAKKIKEKYADQDEEDRELALRLVGAHSAAETAKQKEEEARKKAEDAERTRHRRQEQHEKARRADEARVRRVTAEGDDNDLGEDADPAAMEDEESVRLSLTGLDAFVGSPLPGDEIISALPVCAPWAALARCKYRAKLQPGAMKKGKLVREVLGRWEAEFKAAEGAQARKGKGKAGNDPEELENEETRNAAELTIRRERECIRAWKETEIFGVVPVGKARVVAGPGSGTSGHAKGGKSDKGKAKGKGKEKAKGGKKGK